MVSETFELNEDEGIEEEAEEEVEKVLFELTNGKQNKLLYILTYIIKYNIIKYNIKLYIFI